MALTSMGQDIAEINTAFKPANTQANLSRIFLIDQLTHNVAHGGNTP